MIYLYTGTPGSGKSFHTARDIYFKTRRKKNNQVIANFPVVIENQENFLYKENHEITPTFLINYAMTNHVQFKENQTLLVLDEAQILFNSRDWNSNPKGRMDWIKFFSQHRKYGYTIIMIAQFDRMIDRQIRSLVEYEVSHLKMSNYFRVLPFTSFMCVMRWYGQRMKVAHEVLFYNKKIGSIYNTFATFEGSGGWGVPEPASVGKVNKTKEN